MNGCRLWLEACGHPIPTFMRFPIPRPSMLGRHRQRSRFDLRFDRPRDAFSPLHRRRPSSTSTQPLSQIPVGPRPWRRRSGVEPIQACSGRCPGRGTTVEAPTHSLRISALVRYHIGLKRTLAGALRPFKNRPRRSREVRRRHFRHFRWPVFKLRSGLRCRHYCGHRKRLPPPNPVAEVDPDMLASRREPIVALRQGFGDSQRRQ